MCPSPCGRFCHCDSKQCCRKTLQVCSWEQNEGWIWCQWSKQKHQMLGGWFRDGPRCLINIILKCKWLIMRACSSIKRLRDGNGQPSGREIQNRTAHSQFYKCDVRKEFAFVCPHSFSHESTGHFASGLWSIFTLHYTLHYYLARWNDQENTSQRPFSQHGNKWKINYQSNIVIWCW